MLHPSIEALQRALNTVAAINGRLSAQKLPGAACDVSGWHDREDPHDEKVRQANLCSGSSFQHGEYALVVKMDLWITHDRQGETADEACRSEVMVELRSLIDLVDEGAVIGLVRYWPDTDTWYARPPTAHEEPISVEDGMLIDAREPSNIDRDGALATIDDFARRISPDPEGMAS